MSNESTKVRESTVIKPTYKVLGEDTLPYFESKHHPYTKLNRFDSKPTLIEYKEIAIENSYLRLAFRPALGARLFSAFDKISRGEVFNCIDTVRPSLIAVRGAWIAVGIEFNLCQFPSHTVDNFSLVDYAYRKEEDGSASILLSNLNLTNNITYLVTITLEPNTSRIETRMRTFNTDLVPQRYYFWSNSGIPASEGLRLFYPGYRTNHGKFPVNEEGADLSWYKNYIRAASVFMLDSQEDFFAAYNYDNGTGVVHVADHNIIPGKKFFTWGTSENGLFWKDILSDKGIPYIEIQSGRFLTQGIVEFVNPLAFESWTEYWYPVRSMGGITYANENASLYTEKIDEKKTKVEICPVMSCKDARLELFQDGKKVYEETVTLSPSEVIVKEIEGASKKPLLRIVDSEGREIVSWNFRKYETKLPEVPAWRGEEKDWGWKDSAEELWLKGVDAAKRRPRLIAKRYLEASLERDSNFSRSLVDLGLLYYSSGLYGKAEETLRKALKRDPYNEDARYYISVALTALGEYEEAERNLWEFYTGTNRRTLAFYLLGILRMRTGAYEDAEQMFTKSVRENGSNVRAFTMLSAALRKQGKDRESSEVIAKAYNLMPLDYMVLAEKHFLSSDKEFERIVFADYQKVLQVSKDYMFVGLYDDSLDILKAALNKGISNPMVYYYIGYALKKMGKIEEAIESYKEGGKEKSDYIFPHRLAEIRILQDVVETIPSSPLPFYLLGNVLYHRDRRQEALEKWEEASRLGLQEAVLYRNIGLAYNALANETSKAVEAYKKAISISPKNHALYIELDEVYSRIGLFDERVDLLEKAPREAKTDTLVARLASAYIDAGEQDKAVDIMLKTAFEPMEAYYGFWETYVDALLARGLTSLKTGKMKEAATIFMEATKYPKNLGVGAPHPKYRNDLIQLYYAGLAYEKLGDMAAAQKTWNDALERNPRMLSEHSVFKALILRKLGREEESKSTIEKIMDAAEARRSQMVQEVGDEKGDLARSFSAAGAGSVPGYRGYSNAFAYLHYVKGLAEIAHGKKREGLKEIDRALEITETVRHARWAKKGLIAI